MLRRLLTAAGGLLVLFHVWLFAGQVWDGALADPSLLARWLVAGGLVVALVALRRRGVSLLRGRQAVAVWLLAALLHAPAVTEHIGNTPAPAMPEVVAGLVSTALAGALALGLAICAGLLAGISRPDSSRQRLPLIVPVSGFVRLNGCPAWAPRPPPVG